VDAHEAELKEMQDHEKSKIIINAFQRVTRFYAYVYLILLIITPLFLLGGSAIAFFSKTSIDPVEFRERFLIPGGRLVIGSVSFFIWWRIFLWLSVFFQAKFDRALLHKISIFFVSAFAVETVELILFSAYPSESVNWNEVWLPTFSEHWATNLWMTIQWLLKISAAAGFFITPRTTGLATLLVAGVFYLLSSRHDGKNIV
jgi:hypothetical protein